MVRRSVKPSSKAVSERPAVPSGKATDITTLGGPVHLAPMLEGGQAVSVPLQYFPRTFQVKGNLHTGTFPPVAEWRRAGDCVAGRFERVRPDVGPNNSRLYELVIDEPDLLQGRPEFRASFWGGTQLDALFDTSTPKVEPGDKICVVFLGSRPTKRGLSPVRLFALSVVKGGKVEGR